MQIIGLVIKFQIYLLGWLFFLPNGPTGLQHMNLTLFGASKTFALIF